MAVDVDQGELERYLRTYQDNPDSRVFAPLADLYRRLGRIQEAEEICKEGMQRHPYYSGGRVALAHVLLDAGRFDESLKEAEAVVTYYPDNLLARKILIRSLAHKGDLVRARRELEALRHMAPQVAGDPVLESAVSQATSTPTELPMRPGPSTSASTSPNVRPSTGPSLTRGQGAIPFPSPKPLNITEKVAREGLQPRERSIVQRSLKMQRLLRKKLILESWIRKLGSSSTLR